MNTRMNPSLHQSRLETETDVRLEEATRRAMGALSRPAQPYAAHALSALLFLTGASLLYRSAGAAESGLWSSLGWFSFLAAAGLGWWGRIAVRLPAQKR